MVVIILWDLLHSCVDCHKTKLKVAVSLGGIFKPAFLNIVTTHIFAHCIEQFHKLVGGQK